MICPYCDEPLPDAPSTLCPSCMRPRPKQPKAERVKADVLRSGRERCIRCNGAGIHFHHWLDQQSIRRYVEGLRLDKTSERVKLKRLLSDPNNGSFLCFDCHINHGEGTGVKRFTYDEIPESALVFAGELGEWAMARLKRSYPERAVR